MFNKPPRILAHKSVLKKGNYSTPEYIINEHGLMNRYCPHRMYPIQDIGTHSNKDLLCNFHGFTWDKNGNPLNNDRSIKCGIATEGRSGLLFKNFIEPEHYWVDDLSKETNLEYSHCMQGTSKGSWLWMMEIQADLLHIRSGEQAIHPWLSSIEELEEVKMETGKDWIIQTCSTGWWLCIYPFTFVEWSPGCVAVNYTTPDDINNEFGFSWITQFYYDPTTTQERRQIFEKFEDVFLEDVAAIEKQKGKYFPILKSCNRLEDHCVHYGQWVKENLRKEND